MLLYCGVGKDPWESLELQGDPTSPSERKSVLNIHWKDWCWSWNLMLGKIEGGRRRGRQRMTWLDVIINSMDMSFSKLQELGGQGGPMCCSPWGCKESNTTTTELHWTELRNIITYFKEWVLSGRNWFFFWTLLNKYHFTRQEELISLDRVTPQSAKGCGNFECYKYCHPQHAQWYLIENESGKLVWYNIVQEIE